jgi:hypothetical protein
VCTTHTRLLGQICLPHVRLKCVPLWCWVQTAFVGFAVQALLTREQPIEGLVKHLADPFGHNIVANLGNNAQFF